MDRVDMDDRHVEAAQRPDDHLEPDEQAQPLVGLTGNHMGAHRLVQFPNL